MPFAKGVSGNPSGQPRRRTADGKSLPQLAREYTEEALSALVSVMRDEEAPAAAIVSAVNAILDRGWGKPTQGVELTGKDGEDIKVRQTNDDADAVRSRLATVLTAAGIGTAADDTLQ